MSFFATLRRSISPPPAPLPPAPPSSEHPAVLAYRRKLESVHRSGSEALAGLDVDIDVDLAETEQEEGDSE